MEQRSASGGVLLISSNGAGMGHLMRLTAIADRLPGDVPRSFLSLSTAVPVVAATGAVWEYCPSHGAVGGRGAAWNDLFADRLRLTLRTHRPAVVVFDGTWPYAGLVRVRGEFPQTRFVWVRRAMWKPSVSGRHLGLARSFDLVLEPGERAAAVDRGATVDRRDAVRVGPVTGVDADQVLPRDEARARLGLPPDERALLLMLGAGNINDISSDVGGVVGAVSGHDGWRVHMTRPPIAERGAVPAAVSQVRAFPLAPYLRAFDAAVAASGYNSFHELLLAGVPTVWVPNTQTSTDDQLARARWAVGAGLGWCVTDVASQIGPVLQELVDEPTREQMAVRARETAVDNGAAEAAAHVVALLPGRAAA